VCIDCKHWERLRGHDHGGRRFAPCALMPDTMAKDSRDPRGVTEQQYRMSETYDCGRFSRREQ